MKPLRCKTYIQWGFNNLAKVFFNDFKRNACTIIIA